jgi:hypothetical protein
MDIQELLKDRGVPFVEEGNNVKRGYVNIKCPWCGEADPSEHLGIDLKTGAFACWRNTQHRSKRIHGLLMKLLGCSWEAAQVLLSDTSNLQTIADRLFPKQEESAAEEKLTIPSGLEPLTMKPSHRRFYDYLLRRGYTYNDVPVMAKLYGLKCALTGRFKNRIVFPVVVDGETIGWTGRCIDGGKFRYLSYPGPVVKHNILWRDLLLAGGRKLYICEGPFDALRVDYCSHQLGVPNRATCLFGISYTADQLAKIAELATEFSHVQVLFDHDATAAGMKLREELAYLRAGIMTLPEWLKDPGELSWTQVGEMANP